MHIDNNNEYHFKTFIPPDVFCSHWGSKRNRFCDGKILNNCYTPKKKDLQKGLTYSHESEPQMYLILIKNPYRIYHLRYAKQRKTPGGK